MRPPGAGVPGPGAMAGAWREGLSLPAPGSCGQQAHLLYPVCRGSCLPHPRPQRTGRLRCSGTVWSSACLRDSSHPVSPPWLGPGAPAPRKAGARGQCPVQERASGRLVYRPEWPARAAGPAVGTARCEIRERRAPGFPPGSFRSLLHVLTGLPRAVGVPAPLQ